MRVEVTRSLLTDPGRRRGTASLRDRAGHRTALGGEV